MRRDTNWAPTCSRFRNVSGNVPSPPARWVWFQRSFLGWSSRCHHQDDVQLACVRLGPNHLWRFQLCSRSVEIHEKVWRVHFYRSWVQKGGFFSASVQRKGSKAWAQRSFQQSSAYWTCEGFCFCSDLFLCVAITNNTNTGGTRKWCHKSTFWVVESYSDWHQVRIGHASVCGVDQNLCRAAQHSHTFARRVWICSCSSCWGWRRSYWESGKAGSHRVSKRGARQVAPSSSRLVRSSSGINGWSAAAHAINNLLTNQTNIIT